jgi:hypothetical protein
MIAPLQHELYQRLIHPVCNHQETIASLQLELYYAKTELEKQRNANQRRTEDPSVTRPRTEEPSTNYHGRIESILLKRIDSKGIPDNLILKEIRKIVPPLRRADLYRGLHALQSRGSIMERSDKVWIKV